MTAPDSSSLAKLRLVDAVIDARAPERLSADPSRLRAASLCDVFEEACRRWSPADPAGLSLALAAVAEATLTHFPGNLLWDFEFIAGRLASAEPALRAEVVASMELLHHRFGSRPIAFRYVHDFSYGFDWARWVERDPGAAGDSGPFDLPFLRYLEQRGAELVELIAADDAKYPTLAPGQTRNPFGFSREPADEVRLFRALAARGWLPVEAFRFDATPDWRAGHAKLRRRLAQELGL
ncbi:MAG: ferrochelatase [Polyangiaceae bacterium]|nr:ferrochelatase [Polyangiaceae bacterium]